MMERLEPWLNQQQQNTDWRERNWDFLKACMELLEVSGMLGLDVVLIDTELKRGVFRLLQVDGGARSELFGLDVDNVKTVTKVLHFQRELKVQKQLETIQTERQALAERVQRLEEQMEELRKAHEDACEKVSSTPETAQTVDPENDAANEQTSEKELSKTDADYERLDALRRRADILGNNLTFSKGRKANDEAPKSYGVIHYQRPSSAKGPFRVHNAYFKKWNKASYGSPRAFLFNFPEELGILEKFIEHDEQLYESWYNHQS